MCDFNSIEILEIRISEQEKQIEDLSNIVTEHWKLLSTLRGQIKTLEEKISILEEGERSAYAKPPIERPPHW